MRLVLPLLPLLLPLLSLLPAAHAAPSSTATAPTPTPITLDQAMADPDWIGTPVEAAWWGWNGQLYYKQKRLGSPLRDTYQVYRRECETQ